MSVEERESLFSLTVAILSANFPDTYSADVGHQVASWTKCERSLPHIESMVRKSKEFRIFENESQSFAELLLRCSWYLYERENYSIARSYIDVALQKFSDKSSLAHASAIDLRGLIDLDIRHPAAALEAFEKAYAIRTAVLPSGDAFLAANQVNIGLAFTEMGELEKARDYLQQSIDIRLMHNSDRIGNSYSNMASLLLRMGKPDEAEAMLKSCPSLKNFSDEAFLKTGNPRFSGIRLVQGRFEEALQFASKALGFRRQCLGERIKVCDSLYQVAVLLDRGGEHGTLHVRCDRIPFDWPQLLTFTSQLLQECIKISEGLPRIEGIGHLARANYKLSQILKDLGKDRESAIFLERAVALGEELNQIDGSSSLVKDAISDFENLVPWMLW
ncbi:hypothetical protein NUU61_006891 [Penicillium alfredii]|uniref:MalT-like TPR region domain-containing protein n=1 Tax=Penicillium alfredii TaxID=1506179 RepID=A0A9W9F1Z4_9EURO|nr:uncharacterized protein NUU61_006891 [Penicillium alfredii]KAJ5092021.1 hypothetical protein NUU61_006891 [Penicillium alfredii]